MKKNVYEKECLFLNNKIKRIKFAKIIRKRIKTNKITM